MQSDAATEEDSTTEVTAAVHPHAPWRLARVAALSGFRLHVCFNDGSEGTVELAEFIHSTGAGVFAALRDENVFRQAGILLGAVTWPGDLDLAPDAMYRAIREHGTWNVK